MVPLKSRTTPFKLTVGLFLAVPQYNGKYWKRATLDLGDGRNFLDRPRLGICFEVNLNPNGVGSGSGGGIG